MAKKRYLDTIVGQYNPRVDGYWNLREDRYNDLVDERIVNERLNRFPNIDEPDVDEKLQRVYDEQATKDLRKALGIDNKPKNNKVKTKKANSAKAKKVVSTPKKDTKVDATKQDKKGSSFWDKFGRTPSEILRDYTNNNPQRTNNKQNTAKQDSVKADTTKINKQPVRLSSVPPTQTGDTTLVNRDSTTRVAANNQRLDTVPPSQINDSTNVQRSTNTPPITQNQNVRQNENKNPIIDYNWTAYTSPIDWGSRLGAAIAGHPIYSKQLNVRQYTPSNGHTNSYNTAPNDKNDVRALYNLGNSGVTQLANTANAIADNYYNEDMVLSDNERQSLMPIGTTGTSLNSKAISEINPENALSTGRALNVPINNKVLKAAMQYADGINVDKDSSDLRITDPNKKYNLRVWNLYNAIIRAQNDNNLNNNNVLNSARRIVAEKEAMNNAFKYTNNNPLSKKELSEYNTLLNIYNNGGASDLSKEQLARLTELDDRHLGALKRYPNMSLSDRRGLQDVGSGNALDYTLFGLLTGGANAGALIGAGNKALRQYRLFNLARALRNQKPISRPVSKPVVNEKTTSPMIQYKPIKVAQGRPVNRNYYNNRSLQQQKGYARQYRNNTRRKELGGWLMI